MCFIRFLRKVLSIFFVWRVTPFKDEESDVIVALAFGQRDNPQDDLVNKALADVVRREYRIQHVRAIVQWEIADHIGVADPVQPIVIREHREAGKYLDTNEVLEQSLLIAKEHGWTRATIVAHPDHAWRVAMNAKKIGFQIASVADTRYIGYDPNSTQKWTKSWLRFRFYDTLARVVYLKRGLI